MMQPRLEHQRPRPDFARLIRLGDEVIAALGVGIHDRDQRAVLVGEARNLIDRIQATLVVIEQADPTWAGWGAIEPPMGTMVERLRRDSVSSRLNAVLQRYPEMTPVCSREVTPHRSLPCHLVKTSLQSPDSGHGTASGTPPRSPDGSPSTS